MGVVLFYFPNLWCQSACWAALQQQYLIVGMGLFPNAEPNQSKIVVVALGLFDGPESDTKEALDPAH